MFTLNAPFIVREQSKGAAVVFKLWPLILRLNLPSSLWKAL